MNQSKYFCCFAALAMSVLGGNAVVAATIEIARDEVQRTKQVDNGDGTESLYTYDANGNRLSRLPIDNNRLITVTVDPPNSGTVTGAGPTLFNTQAVLSASPIGSFIFSGWYEANTLASISTPYTFTVDTSRTLVAKFALPVPEIAVEDTTAATAVNLTDGSSTLLFVHPASVSRTLTVRNIGTASLTGLSATIDGPGAGLFSSTSLPAALAPASSVTLTVQFTASSPGISAAVLHILSNDSDESPFDIALSGDGTPPTETVTFTAGASVPYGINTPVTAVGYSADGKLLNAALTFEPPPGTILTVVRNIGTAPISGEFEQLPQGGTVSLKWNGREYPFVINYFGGDGNDIELVWKETSLVGWGYNEWNQLGDGTNTNRLSPVPIGGAAMPARATWIETAVGESHSLALTSDGRIFAWGWNDAGHLGDGTTTNRSSPVQVTASGALAGKKVVRIAAGQYHSLALCSDGTVYAWGTSTDGQLGDGGYSEHYEPAAVSTSGALAGKKVIAISAGALHSLALTSEGKIVAWGSGQNGTLGTGNAMSSAVPIPVTSGALSGKTVVRISAGAEHNLALCSDSTLIAWGSNWHGELGDGSDSIGSQPVAILGSAADVSAGGQHSIALDVHGNEVAWGSNSNGQIGNGSLTQQRTPTSVQLNLAQYNHAVSAGARHSFSLVSFDATQSKRGRVWAWGANGAGQLGNGTTASSSLPVYLDHGNALADRPVMSLARGPIANHMIAVAGNPLRNEPRILVEQSTALASGGSVGFGAANIGTSKSLIFTVRNTGTADLNVLAVTIDGGDAASFTVAAGLASSVAPGGSTTFTVQFSPASSGHKAAALHITSNDPDENPFDLALSGEASPATTPIVRFSDDFGSSGIDASKWTVSGNSVSVSSGVMRVEQNQTDAGGTLVSIPISVGSHQIISISRKVNLHYANSFYAALMRVSIGTLPPFGMSYENYSYVSPYDVARFGFFMTRSGASAHAVAGQADTSAAIPAVWDTWFEERISYNTDTGMAEYFINNVSMLTYNVGILPAIANPTMTLSFGSWGWFTDHYHWFDDLVVTTTELPAGDAAEISVEDSSATPPISLADATSVLSFGSKAVSSSATKTLTIHNAGRSALTGLSAIFDGASASDFNASTLPASIDAGGTAVLTVGFTPTAQGIRSAALHIASNDFDESPFDLALSGIGYVTPFITAHPVGGTHGRGSSFALTVAAAGGGPLSYRWTLNGQALPDTESSLSVQDASFLNAGTYAVEVTGDGGTTRSQSALITIPLDSYATWQSKVFTQAELDANDPAVIGKSAMSGTGGIANLIHYAMGSRNRRQLPEGAFGMEQGTTFHYNRLVEGGGLSYNVEFSRDLLSWESAGTNLEEASSTAPNSDGVTEKVSLRLNSQLQTELGKAFFRIRLEEAEILLHASSFNYCDGTDAAVSPNVIRSEAPIPGRFEDTENGIRFRASFFRSGGAILTKSPYVPAGRTFEFLWDGSGGGSFMQPVCGFAPNQWTSHPSVDNEFVVCEFGNVWSSWLASPGTVYKTSVSFTATAATLITTNAATGQELDRKTRSGDFTLPMRPYLRGGDTYNFNDAFLRLHSLKIGPAVGPP